ncbi:MAG TPA: hypothetical protein VF904_17575 [Anaeromyxobacteraceae bacterium]
MRLLALAAASLLGFSATALAQEAKPAEGAPPAEAPKPPPPPQFKFELHGFVSGSIYAQDANLGVSEGQQALFVNAQTAAARAPNTDKLVLGGDVRQSRFNFSLAGPQVLSGATPKAVLEIDFFGGYGSGNYGDVSLLPRLRFAYGELNWGANRIQVGQNNDLIFAMAPVSLAHIAFPYGYGSGNIGWRRPGVFGYHSVGPKSGTNVELAWEVGKANWADQGNQPNATAGVGGPAIGGNGIGSNVVGAGGDKYGFGLGQASGLPAVEARLTAASGTMASAFVTGHWHKVDRSGVDAQSSVATGNAALDVVAGNAGFRVVGGPVTLAATGFVGKNLAPIIGDFLQFQPNTVRDVHEYGGWVQAGFNFTKELSLWGYIGVDKPKFEDAVAAGYTRVQNVTSTGMLQYREAGYALGFEWIHFHTTTRVPASGTTPNLSGALNGNQWIASANYFF